jgi:hypothetical protein
MIDGAAAVLPEHATRMRIVDHHDAALFVGKIAQRGQCAEVAVHAEDAIGDDERTLSAGQCFDDGPGGRRVAMREDLDRRATETRARR